nr:MAG TPA: Endodeoxyribonuclease RusA [Caudoviricetes sp.]
MSVQLVWQSRVLPLTRSKLLTANDKMHWAARARLTKQLRQWGYLLGREGEGVARLGLRHARVEMEFAYPDRRRRDRSNLAPTVKAIMDGLIDAGLLPDDADRFLDGPHTVIATRLADHCVAVPRYEVRIRVYADADKKEKK